MKGGRLCLFMALVMSQNFAAEVVSGDTYFIEDYNTTTYIYSKEYAPMMQGLQNYEAGVLDALGKEYGYRFDERLYVMLASKNNQITNAFSTQIPFNAQLHYGAGAGGGGLGGTIDWMKNLLIHESSHNFQLNAKENSLSKLAHNIFGANFLTMLGIIPIFPLPNYYLGRFLLEGNGVLNESRFGIGGRLYSSAVIAQSVVLARAGKLTPQRVYNNILEYPYSSQFYHVGGLFQAYLAERYGAKRVNGFYKVHSKHYLPFMIEDSFQSYFGKKLSTLIEEFNHALLTKHHAFHSSKGNILLSTQTATRMQKNGDTIDFMVSNLRSSPLHVQLDEDGKIMQQKHTTQPMGSLFKIAGRYYSQSTQAVSPNRIIKGLYDKESKLLSQSDSKIVQGILPDGELVYVDVKESYERWHLYVGDEAYGVVDSTVLVMPSGDIYYFRQDGKLRTAYKNKTKLFSYEGYYGSVCDVDEKGNIYFVAPSKDGSGLYRYSKKGIQRVGDGDDIIDMKLLSGNKMVIATVTQKGTSYLIQPIQTHQANIPHIRYSFSNIIESDRNVDDFTTQLHTTSSPVSRYRPLQELRYSSLTPAIGYNSTDGVIVGGVVTLADPLGYNTLTLPFHTESAFTMLGAIYENSAELLHYRLGVFGIFNANEALGYRDYGITASASYPLLAEGYERASLRLSYDKPYDRLTQKPLSLMLHWDDTKQYGYSMYPNDAQSIDMFAIRDRNTNMFGISYDYWQDFKEESYINFQANYFQSSGYDATKEKGITVARRLQEYAYNPASLEMYGLTNNMFVDEALKLELGAYKVLNFSQYFYTFPLSLQRESLYAKARYYRLGQDERSKEFQEYVLGTQVDLLLYHELRIPLTIEYIYNEDVAETKSLRVGFGFGF